MSEYRPIKLFCYAKTKPNEKLFQLCILLDSSVVSTDKVMKLLNEAKVNVINASIFSEKDENDSTSTVFSAFIKTSKTKISRRKLKMNLLEIKGVKNVIIREPKPAPFETFHFPVMYGDSRAIIMPIVVFQALWDGFERILTDSGMAVLLYNSGKQTGVMLANCMKQMFKLEGKDVIRAMAQALRNMGWGVLKIKKINVEYSYALLTMEESFEAMAWKRRPYPVCHWTRGFLAGAMTIQFKKKVEATETKCIAKGDEKCEFEISPNI